MKITKEILDCAQILWNYHHVNHELSKSDLILALGSHDKRVANRAAHFYLSGYASKIIFSGGLGNLTSGIWDIPEADQFAEVAMNMGVPKEDIFIENKSTNTGENIIFSYELIKRKKLKSDKIILVQKPYMERRTYATFKKQWPGNNVEILITSPNLKFLEYPNEEIGMEKVINIMVGDLQRIKEYPAKGFQIYQSIPEHVWNAYLRLVEIGFVKHLI